MNSANRYVNLNISLLKIELKHILTARIIICSYIIQNFYDTFRQSMIDLMQGNIRKSDELQFNEALKVLASIAELPVEVSSYYHYGALNNELQLTESILKSARYRIT